MKNKWPFLTHLLEENKLIEIDLALADFLVKEKNEAAACLVSFLSAAARCGHLCVRVNKDAILPDPAELIQDLTGDEKNRFHDFIFAGSQTLPKHVVKNNDHVYFERYFSLECKIKDGFENILKSSPGHEISKEMIDRLLLENQTLLPEQKEAVKNVGTNCLSVICGGPGTGKTFTAAWLVKTVWQSLSQDLRKKFRICLAAPTGKAASNMEASLKMAAKDLPDFCAVEAKTIHSLLKIGSKRSSAAKVHADFVIIDECSMIDVFVFEKLLSSLKQGTRLVLLGDPHQLPSVEAGSVFSDLVNVLRKNQSKALTELKVCKRAELKSILEFAEFVKEGEAKKALSSIRDSRLFCDQVDGLIKEVMHNFPYEYNEKTEHGLIQSFQRFRLLSPLRKGPFGVESLNRLLYREIESKIPFGHFFAAPILLVKNDYRLNMWNGEVGVLVRKKTDSGHLQKGDFALFEDRGKIPALLLPHFEYAFCMSVHKSQGSEFDEVLLLLPDGSEVFGREVLYTAATRAKKKLLVCGSDEVIEKTIVKTSSRLSNTFNHPG